MNKKYSQLSKRIEFARRTTKPHPKVALYDGVILIAGFLIALLWIAADKYLKIEFTTWMDGMVIAIIFFIWGWIGIVGIVYEEIPQAVIVRGRPAKILGYFLWLFCWGLSIYVLLRIM